jgi:thiol-disulfide isomerase/thioredoxin
VKHLTLLLLLLLPVWNTTMAQTSKFDTLRDAENGYLVYRGEFTFTDLLNEPDFGWMAAGAGNYQPSAAAIATLKQKLDGCQILLFMGTWCSDSRDLVPRLYKVLQMAGYANNTVKIYGMDRPKKSGTNAETTWKVTLVPTVIVVKNHIELGRITENAQKSVEEDLAAMLNH